LKPTTILCVGTFEAVAELRRILQAADLPVDGRDLDTDVPQQLKHAALVVIDGSRRSEEALQRCQRLRTASGDSFIPILYVTADASPRARLSCLESGADAYVLRPFEPAELIAQVRALLRLRERHARLATKNADVQRINKKLQAAYQRTDLELDLARRLQESFLPRTLPSLPSVRFAVKYKPCGRVGGDFYDAFRQVESHVGFYVADAMGHGVRASLLTVFVKKSVSAKEITGNDYRLVPPSEVLDRLNRDLVEQALSESPFITMAYMLYDVRDGSLQFARAGHPYPIYLPKGAPPRLWKIEGTLLGVFDSRYRHETHVLGAGDKLLLYTDGIDAAAFADQPLGVPSLLAAAERCRDLPIGAFVDRLSLDLFGQGPPTDDLTIFGMEVTS
jgi:sigma-B regulation protein RsbU (phosphoserine phosphatase)